MTERVLLAARQANIKRVVFVSSIKVLGESTQHTPFSHASVPQPEGAYGISKLEAEQRVQAICREHGMEWVIVRPPLVYSPLAKGNIEALNKALQHRLPLPLASIRNRRHVVELTDLCDILLRCIVSPSAANSILLAASQPALSTPELIRKLGDEQSLSPLLLPCPTWALKLALYGLGKSEQAKRLLGNLELDDSYTRNLLGL